MKNDIRKKYYFHYFFIASDNTVRTDTGFSFYQKVQEEEIKKFNKFLEIEKEIKKTLPYFLGKINISTCRKYDNFVKCFYKRGDREEYDEPIAIEECETSGCPCCDGLKITKISNGSDFEKIEKENFLLLNEKLMERIKFTS